MNASTTLNRRLVAALAGVLALVGLSAPPAQAQSCETGTAEADLDVNNVRARLFNIGGLFWRGSGAQYEVPQGSGLVSIFASGLWVAGQVDGDLRFAGSTYGDWEYWPGPLTAAGTVTSATCQLFDRFWKVNFADIRDFNNGVPEGTERSDGTIANYSDLQSWPVAQGAPFYVDLNGNSRRDVSRDDDEGNEDGITNEPRIELDLGDAGYGTRQIDLAANERPDIIGDQGIWWVMNDAGGSHDWGGTEAIGIEVRGHAFAFRTADALNNTTFYRYQIIYRGAQDMTDSYIGLFSDPDLGEFNDDYVGSDPELGLGFVYNGDTFDEGGGGYGQFPPALGYDFFQGPLVTDDGEDNDNDGEVDEADERLAIEKFFYFTNGNSGPTVDPNDANEAYSYMQGFWKDGTPLKLGGDGYNTNGPAVDFAFPGDPPGFWSEYNTDGTGATTTPADRRFGVSSGPFTFSPGELQEIVFGIVWSQATGSQVQPQIQSVRQLKFDDRTAQAAFNAEFNLPDPPPAVNVIATGLDQEIILEFISETGDNADVFGYEVPSPFAPASAADRTYNFEGFKIFQFRDTADQTGTLIETFDLNNNITTVVDEQLDSAVGAVVTGVVAQGKDNGTATDTPTILSVNTSAFTQQPLRNGTSYYFGVQTYAVNEASTGQKVFASPITRVEVRPTMTGAVIATAETGSVINGEPGAANVGGGSFSGRVVNPGALNGSSYNVEFFTQNDADGDPVGTSYNIVNTTTGTVLFNGADYYAENGALPPQRQGALVAEGISFDILGPAPGPYFDGGFNAFVEVQGPGGFDSCGPTAASTIGCTSVIGFNNIYQSFNGTADYIGYHIGDGPEFSIGRFAPNEYEIRFTPEGGYAVYGFTTDNVHPVPFEVWDIGLVPPGVENDPSDDVRMIPFLFSDNSSSADRTPECTQQFDYVVDSIFGIGLVTPRLYMYYPVAGQTYADFAAAAEADLAGDPDNCAVSVAAYDVADTGRGRPIQRFVMEQAGARGINDLDGTIIRFYSTDPNQPGDVFTIDASDSAAIIAEDRTAEEQEAALDLMAITPNPYRGFSGYESSGNSSVARFVNVPAQATIRIYTLAGTLIRTIEKNSAGSATIDWDLTTEAGLPVASGMYLIHIEARQSDGSIIGERVLKFGVIQRRTQLDVL